MILVSGCSWSDRLFKSDFHVNYDTKFPKWYDYMDTDEEVASVGMSGLSNSTIIDRASKQIQTRKDISTVVIALTEWPRFNLFDFEINPSLIVVKDVLMKKKQWSEKDDMNFKQINEWMSYHEKYVNLCNMEYKEYIPHIVNNTILKLKTLQDVCKLKGIKLIVFQMIWPMPHAFLDLGIGTLIKNQMFQEMFEDGDSNFLNFPFFRELGGSCVESILKKRDDYRELIVSDVDKHPNGKGHKLIGEWFNEQIQVS